MADPFEIHRDTLFGLAYRMLGTVSDAEDAVQDTYLRWINADQGTIDAPGGWLRTVCSRICIDTLRKLKTERERYTGPWLPEPVATAAASASDSFDRYETLSMALLLVLERLSPVERAAFLLHEVFDYSHKDVAMILQKSQAATRQIVSRARTRVKDEKPRFDVAPDTRERVTMRFFETLSNGDLEPLQSLLAEDAECWTDGGGKAIAALNVVQGANNIARFLLGLQRKAAQDFIPEPIMVNGSFSILLRQGNAPASIFSLHVAQDGRVSHIFVVRNPDKLARFRHDTHKPSSDTPIRTFH